MRSCTFCEKPKYELVFGKGKALVFICFECVEECAAIVDDQCEIKRKQIERDTELSRLRDDLRALKKRSRKGRRG